MKRKRIHALTNEPLPRSSSKWGANRTGATLPPKKATEQELDAWIARPVGRGHKSNCPCRLCVTTREERIKSLAISEWAKNPKILAYYDALLAKEGPTRLHPEKSAEVAGLKAPPPLDDTTYTHHILMRAIREAGGDEQYFAQMLMALTKAKKVTRMKLGSPVVGEEVREFIDDDGHLQHKALTTALELGRHFPRPGESPVQVAVVLRVPDRPMTVEEWNRRYGGEPDGKPNGEPSAPILEAELVKKE